MQFLCPICHNRLHASSDLADEQVVCPVCTCPILVPHDPPRGLVTAQEAPLRLRQKEDVGEPDMDMTPMVDVTFLLLIFFMVTAAFSLQKSFQFPAPEEDQQAAQVRTIRDFETDDDFVVVRVDRFNTFFVTAADWDREREATTAQELIVQLREARQPSGGDRVPTRLLVVANGEALHEYVVAAMDAGSEVGMQEVSLVSVEDDES